jgi:hypothetical protein
MLGDAVSVASAAGERAEDEHVESAGEEVVSHRLSMEAYGVVGVKSFPIGERWEGTAVRATIRGGANREIDVSRDGGSC